MYMYASSTTRGSHRNRLPTSLLDAFADQASAAARITTCTDWRPTIVSVWIGYSDQAALEAKYRKRAHTLRRQPSAPQLSDCWYSGPIAATARQKAATT